MRRRFLLSAPLLVAAMQPPPPAPEAAKPLAETCPNLTLAQIAGIENYKGEFAENALYARAYCVSVEEAERRMAIQLRGSIGSKTEPGPPPPQPPDSIGTINTALQEKESGTFAGLWIQHRPDYRVVVAFTRNSAATLARYTKDPLYKPVDRPGPTLAELRATQDRLTKALAERGFRWSSAGAREDKGTVEITLGQEAEPIRAAAARGEFELPPFVVLIEPRSFAFPAPPAPAPGDSRVRSFPQFGFRTDNDIRTLVGVPDVPTMLRLVDGCLVVGTGSETRTALWQASDALDLSDPKRVAVVDRLSGIRVEAGQEIVLEGLQPGEERVPERIVGTEGCPGPYRVVRGFLPKSVWDERRLEGSLANRIREFGDRAAALADYEADRKRLAELRAWRETMLADRGDVVASIAIDEENATAHLFHTAAGSPDRLVPEALRTFVTAQQVPVGHDVLESARLSLENQLGEAGIEAQVQAEAIEGVVRVSGADPRRLSAAAMAGRLVFPDVARIGFEGAAPLSDGGRRMAADPEAVWLRLEAAPDFAEIRKLVEATELPVMEPAPPPDPRRRGAPPAPPRIRYSRPSRAASLQTSHFLVAYGQTAREIAALKALGFDPVDALDAMNGRPNPVSSAILARQVVVAELAGLDTRAPGKDGFRSTARWRVVETLKGSARPGDVLQVRMFSGEDGNGAVTQSNEEPVILPGLPGSLQPGGRWLLHLNDSLYAHQAFIHGGKEAALGGGPVYVQTLTPAPLAGGQVKGVFFGQAPFDLDGLRKALAPLQSAMARAGLNKAPAR